MNLGKNEVARGSARIPALDGDYFLCPTGGAVDAMGNAGRHKDCPRIFENIDLASAGIWKAGRRGKDGGPRDGLAGTFRPMESLERPFPHSAEAGGNRQTNHVYDTGTEGLRSPNETKQSSERMPGMGRGHSYGIPRGFRGRRLHVPGGWMDSGRQHENCGGATKRGAGV